MNDKNLLSVNDLFKDNISTITAQDIVPTSRYADKESRVRYVSLEKTINDIGEMSTKAQGLNRVLTTLEKLRSSSDHKLYSLKDGTGKGGTGEVIGILKVGPKQLYLRDTHSKLAICKPMCVLDFYVLESMQRRGFGKKLFDYMLEDQKLKAFEVAIDGPSHKMLQFLRKHYNFNKILKHANNFAVCDTFFESTNIGATWPVEKNASPLPNLRKKGVAGAGIHWGRSMSSTAANNNPAAQPQTERPHISVLKKWSSEAGAVIHGGRT